MRTCRPATSVVPVLVHCVASVSSIRLAWFVPSPLAVAPLAADAMLCGKTIVTVRFSPGVRS
jgi:hypothetical protein